MNAIQYIPLHMLRPSPKNARKTKSATIASLAASIRAHGLAQNLNVEDVGDGFEVVAGSRRLQALRQLVGEGHIPADYLVPCRQVDGDIALEVSAAENVVREDMHPADEFDAFAKLVEDGLTVTQIADHFGQTEVYVKRRLKLANVAPAILQEYRDGKATLEQVMALALTDHHDTQLRVWREAKTEWDRAPENLREAITEDEISVDSPLGRFVTVAAYEKADGAIRRDLFSDEDDGHFCDVLLLRSLADAKLQKTAAKVLKEGWAWTEARTNFPYGEQSQFGKAESTWSGSKQTWSTEAMSNAGAIVTIGHNGQTEIHRGLVRPQDRKAAAPATGGKVSGGKEPKADKKPGDLSFAAVQRLQAEATAIARVAIADSPRTALALLVAELAGKVFYRDFGGRRWIHIAREHSGRVHSGPAHEALTESVAAKQVDELEESWRAKLPGKPSELRDWALEQEFGVLSQLLAFLVAREVEVVDIHPSQRDGVVQLAKAAGVDLGEQWQATANWFEGQPKGYILAVVTEHLGKNTAAQLAKIKGKEALAARAAKLLELSETGPGHKPRWLPKPLRAPAAKKPRDGKQRAANDRDGDE